MEEKDSVVIHIHSQESGEILKKIRVPIEELVICWMNFHYPQKKHIIKS